MAGHSKWANIKHRKAAQDAKKGKIFTKIARELTVAAKMGGSDPEMNPRLRVALEKAKAANMPKENVERAIKKGTGEGNEANYEDVIYEGYGPGGVAIMVQALTDNKNRTVAEVRSTLTKKGGSLGEAGCVSWLFEKKGIIGIKKDIIDEDTLMDIVLEAGAEDLKVENENYEVVTEPSEYYNVKKALEEKGIAIEYAELTMRPKNTVKVEGEDAKKLLALIEALEDLDDVQEVYANFDIEDKVMEEMGA
ncbi:YebC/PmpR family DNA-binding transcriptional regulator [Deferribacter autotrophicus]|uniref:Probable transcriptional regulatory protein FHQ18_06325 n=1 Tax=Deferribacter autotrophicus TaxID=500465 RepID=A0A5A8F3B4_9BACT|nr:YebC/PmpR family DNA-binding transcriptional regulator [Deferribacter autotrophicus]KAA0258006.1 YebC/PmpR family DNA-binding transcriptional regulator [Deferribacter autotrophicus]